MGCSKNVRQPTRGPYLLDLVLSTFTAGARCDVRKGLQNNDHDAVLATFKIHMDASLPVRRIVFDYKSADWTRLRLLLKEYDWRSFFCGLTSDECTERLTAKILEFSKACIPEKLIFDKCYRHPWLNSACVAALAAKHAAIGSAGYTAVRDECSRIFMGAFHDYVKNTKRSLQALFPSSRGWWKITNSLLTRPALAENIPPLQRPDKSWVMDGQQKADLLAEMFRAKAVLPPEASLNMYSDFSEEPVESMHGFLRIRVREVAKVLNSLDETSGTGPDLLPARILKRCYSELALPVTVLVRTLLSEGRWPARWRLHWVHALHKRRSRAVPGNYREVHLTPQLSKVTERAIGAVFLPWLESRQLYGPNQYAYGRGKGYKDVLFVNVCH